MQMVLWLVLALRLLLTYLLLVHISWLPGKEPVVVVEEVEFLPERNLMLRCHEFCYNFRLCCLASVLMMITIGLFGLVGKPSD